MSNENIEDRNIEYLNTTCQEVDNCSFSNWYPKFKSHTFKSRILQLSNEFVDYLNAEGIYLPEDGYSVKAEYMANIILIWFYSQPRAATIEEIDSDEEITEFPNQEDDSKVKR